MTNNTTIIRDCSMQLMNKEPMGILLNAIRIFCFIAFSLWLILGIRFKEFHRRDMVYLFNLNILSLIKSVYGIHLSFHLSKCFVASSNYCFFQAFYQIFAMYLTNYGTIAFALHRLANFYVTNLSTKLKWNFIIPSLSGIWVSCILFSLTNLLLLGMEPYFIAAYEQCIVRVYRKELAFYFNLFFAIIFSNSIFLFAYITVLYKLKVAKRKANAQRRTNLPRITIHIILCMITYQLTLASYIIDLLVLANDNPSFNVVQVNRIFRWAQNYYPIFLLYCHPFVIKRIKNKWEQSFLKRLLARRNNRVHLSDKVQIR